MLSLPTSYVEPATQRADSVAEITGRPVWGKRLLDLVVSTLVVILIISWLIPLLSIAIRLTSPGPPLFVQLRTGRNGRLFRCLKFRTMSYEPNAVQTGYQKRLPRYAHWRGTAQNQP